MMRAGHMLSWPAERYPDRIAVTYEGQHMTFREVNARVNRLAHGLMAMGLQRGDRVAALLYNSPRAIEVRFALMKAGLCMVALNVRQSEAEHAYIVNHSESRVLILDADYLSIWERMRTTCAGVQQVIVAALQNTRYLAYDDLMSSSPEHEPEVMVSPQDLERIAYTSGTTGRPKGIMKTIGNDLARMRIDFMNEDRLTTADDIMLNVAPLTHAARVFFRKHYLKGARNIILRRFTEAEVLDTMQRERVTTAMFVPTMIVRLTLHPGIGAYDLSSLQRVFYGTAPMSADKLKQAIRIFGNIFRQNYGLSEATQPVLCLCPRDIVIDGNAEQLRRLASAGRPALGVEVRIVNAHGQEAAAEETGDLLVRGDMVMTGYWKDAQATREVIDADGWLHTGDVALRDADGYVYLVDRKKDMLISGGFNIYPREVEQVIEMHQGVQEVAVIGVADEIWGERVKALVVPRPGVDLTAEEIVAWCQDRLASYKKPKVVEIVAALPKNFQGKILKRALRETV